MQVGRERGGGGEGWSKSAVPEGAARLDKRLLVRAADGDGLGVVVREVEVPGEPSLQRRDETCPISTGGETRRVQLVREGGGQSG